MVEDATEPYRRGLQEFAARFESVDFEDVHAAAKRFIPTAPGVVLDVGAGTGRDAARFADDGWRVIAVEPLHEFRAFGQHHHPSSSISWIDDRLPAMDRVAKLHLSFDLIWLSAVWMHVPALERRRAFRKLASLLKPRGRMIISLRQGALPEGRAMHGTSVQELETLAGDNGLTLRADLESPDALGRADVGWRVVVLEMPDDSSGALPLIRGIILKDQKAATYKLALLRVLARVADQSAAMTEDLDDHVRVPLGLIALYWIRIFKPLVEQGLPQAPLDGSGRRLGFAKQPFHDLRSVAPVELRPGATFYGMTATAVVAAVGDAAYTIARMPARYLTHDDGRPILPTVYEGRPQTGPSVVIDSSFVRRYGSTLVPRHLWTALRRLSVWIEPMLQAEWTRLIHAYAFRQGRALSTDSIHQALRWIDPLRDTVMVRSIAQRCIDTAKPLYCVWTGERIRDVKSLEVDHCFPFSSWPCDDLWNLLPSSKGANQRKGDKLITADLLQRSSDRIDEWWNAAYRNSPNFAVRSRFETEARSSLPILADPHDALDGNAILGAMDFHRLRLRQDQQMVEWQG